MSVIDLILKSDKIKKIIKKSFMLTGFQIKSYPDTNQLRRMMLIKHFAINTIFDVGANAGQYAEQVRLLGYKNRIISFEPLSDAFNILSRKAKSDNLWTAYNYALGDKSAKSVINIAGNSGSSSILEMLPAHLNSAPESQYIGTQEIEIRTFDSIFNEFSNPNENIMLKIDTQGFEKNVILGAKNNLKNIKIIQLEMSLISLYQNEIVFEEMLAFMDSLGFTLYSLENGFYDHVNGRLLQVDGVFVNKNIE